MFKPTENGSARSHRRLVRGGAKTGQRAPVRSNGTPLRRRKRGRAALAGLAKLHDKQSERDHRDLRINKVGVRGLRFPAGDPA